ncbi:MAG: glycosyltransferase family 4 protein [Bacteroidota bacterium]|nr:glycosyltransferase family 4 protein [Bacteroidota bacterium]
MNIVQLSHYKLPTKKYGGTERVIYWNSRALARLGHKVYLLAPKGTEVEGVNILPYKGKLEDNMNLIPADADIAHIQYTPDFEMELPFLVTIHGNKKPGEKFLPNTVFVSRNHAARHDSDKFVYNGIDPAEYIYKENKNDYFLFLSKTSRKEKGLDVALRLSKKMGFRLKVAGGRRLSINRKIKFYGEVGEMDKAELIAGAKALLFPISWEEPFGLVLVEALVSGTPVIATPRGAVPEIITPEVGFLCNEETRMIQAIENIDSIKPADCRKRVLNNFTDEIMARNYLHYYRSVLSKKLFDE